MSHLPSPDALTYRPTPTLEELWRKVGFTPNPAQEAAIRHVDGPLYLPAGPGSGKTRVLLWRALNLIVYHDVPPADIFLSTFTEKAALQLREGLQSYLATVNNATGRAYDLSPMYIGTVHSLCGRMLTDRRFAPDRRRTRPPRLIDDLDQYFYLFGTRRWNEIAAAAGLDSQQAVTVLNNLYEAGYSISRHKAITNGRSFFARLAEECIDPADALHHLMSGAVDGDFLDQYKIDPDQLAAALRLCRAYQASLAAGAAPVTDFALLQAAAADVIAAHPDGDRVFRHVIIDEYQDTNTIQERIFFALAAGHGNICVVGDDDQALYRFRGATVENFVRFPERCAAVLGRRPRVIVLNTNYRSRSPIVDFYTAFIDRADWTNTRQGGAYRVVKDIRAHRQDAGPAVVIGSYLPAGEAIAELAALTRRLLDEGVVEDPNQIAFLYSYLRGNEKVQQMKAALEAEGLRVYAPRAGRFLEVDEAVALFGLFARVLGRPARREEMPGKEYADFHDWIDAAESVADALMADDPQLAHYVAERRAELAAIADDYTALSAVVDANNWDTALPYEPERMRPALAAAPGLSARARRLVEGRWFERIAQNRIAEGRPFPLSYALSRATAVDWSVLDLFHQLCGFDHFRAMFQLAESGADEGPICNLSLISRHLARFMDLYARSVITARGLAGERLSNNLFTNFLYALFRLGESEYEDSEAMFPRGRIPFLTIHQAKGLEFPVVVLPGLYKKPGKPQRNELLVAPFVGRDDGEPLDRMNEFDIMRIFYVALSRAENLLVLARPQRANVSRPFKEVIDKLTPVTALDLGGLPRAAHAKNGSLPHTYSYTADFLTYRKCPRQYMVFRRYGLEPSRSQTMFFGTLVHRTLEDLHNHFIARRAAGAAEPESEEQIEALIHEAFEDNYEMMRAEEGRPISPEARETALNHVLLYWRLMRDVAEAVTDTEVKLSLPNQVSPGKRTFTIQGVVDIVRDGERTMMYDIKTHDGGYVRGNRGLYADQLNVYAHIWHHLRGQPLDGCAVIATSYPDAVKRALAGGDAAEIEAALADWQPLVDIPFDLAQVEHTIDAFGAAVDDIETGQFGPPPPSRLAEVIENGETFATRVCIECDARYSCASYRRYAADGRGPTTDFFRLYADERDREMVLEVGLNAEARVALTE